MFTQCFIFDPDPSAILTVKKTVNLDAIHILKKNPSCFQDVTDNISDMAYCYQVHSILHGDK